MEKFRMRRIPFARRFSARRPRLAAAAAGALVLLALVGVAAGPALAQGSGIIRHDPPLPSMLGISAEQVREQWGGPRYIKVAPHDGDTRYAYFTPLEWERLAALAPATQGEDVFVHPGLNLQIHLRYRPVFTVENRFQPQFVVGTVTYVFEQPTPLERVAEVLPNAGGNAPLAEAQWFRSLADGQGRTVFVHWPHVRHPAAPLLTPFRADPGVTLYWELGLAVPSEAVDGRTAVSYVIERLDQFTYPEAELEPIPNPFRGGTGGS